MSLTSLDGNSHQLSGRGLRVKSVPAALALADFPYVSRFRSKKPMGKLFWVVIFFKKFTGMLIDSVSWFLDECFFCG